MENIEQVKYKMYKKQKIQKILFICISIFLFIVIGVIGVYFNSKLSTTQKELLTTKQQLEIQKNISFEAVEELDICNNKKNNILIDIIYNNGIIKDGKLFVNNKVYTKGHVFKNGLKLISITKTHAHFDFWEKEKYKVFGIKLN